DLHREKEGTGPDALQDRHRQLSSQHKLEGTACYYADIFEGRRTANGEIFRQSRFTAAHRTLPLGTWVEVTSVATGRKARVRINDRGPFSGGFILDLTRTAARSLGVDRARDRRVAIRVLALPGEPLPAEE
ncbi:MAG TPA: septal ring lytic transglycosylase RlpA family protein, partial [Thermoanaerobaculia bacterium]|nr:septal ring lytic transglycosylase RlpA family protein [Thermoanaerobaculia bacterium]